MKIGFLLDSISPLAGGVSESARELARSLTRYETVEVFGIEDQHSSGEERSWQPAPVHVLPAQGLRGLGYSSRLLPALVEADLDVLLSHGLWKYSSLASHRWHRVTGRPHIIHPHGMLDPWAIENAKWKKRLAYLVFEGAHLRGASCLRALCNSEAESIRAFTLRNPVCVIPNGIDLPDLSIRRDRPWGDKVGGRKVLLYLGRLHPKKNLSALLDAWKAAHASTIKAQEWVLVIAGWDQNNHEADLKRQSRELSLDESVRFAGPLFGDKKAAAYQSAEAFVLPTLSEGLPMVILEAWAFGKPVVMTPACNLPEGVNAGAALSTGTSADAIKETLLALFEMEGTERMAMGERGRALVSEKFAWPAIAEEMKKVCDWVVNGGSAPASVRFD